MSVARAVAACVLAVAAADAGAAPVDTLRDFVRDVKSGHAGFTQVVSAADGSRRKTSSGSFDFQRPNRFRFTYAKPFEQTIVADGEKVWIYDKDLNQASSRRIAAALGATPAAILAGGSIDQDFDLSNLPAQGGLEWVEAKPKARDGAIQTVRIGFRDKVPQTLEIVDAFGQRSTLTFSAFAANASVPADAFRFVPPPGADVIEQ